MRRWKWRTGWAEGTVSAADSCMACCTGWRPQECVDMGAAHGALLQTTRGDTSMVTMEEILHVMKGGSARIKR